MFLFYVNPLGLNRYCQSESICPVLLEIFKIARFASKLLAFQSQINQETSFECSLELLHDYIRVGAMFVGHLT